MHKNTHILKRFRQILVIGYLIIVVAIVALLGWDIDNITNIFRAYPVWGPVLYVGAHIVATVVLPLSSLPLVPFASVAWGVWVTSVLNIIGWWLGSLIAFEISRNIGRPLIVYLVSLDRLDAWIEKFSHKTHFMSIVIARSIFPVEVPSYALGLFPAISFRVYASASLLGIIPFAIIWSFSGKALIQGEWGTLLFVGLGGGALFVLSILVWRYHSHKSV